MEDHFDRIPNCMLLDIIDRVYDAKSLVRCLSVSKRFRSLVPYATSLRLQVDRVIDPTDYTPSPFFSFLETLSTFLNNFFTLSFPPTFVYSSPSSALRAFRRVRHLDLQLPSDDGSGRPSGGVFVRYRATFGKRLEKCVVIVGFRRKEEDDDEEETGDVGRATEVMKDKEEECRERVSWVIGALVDACRRHDYVARELIGDHPGLESLRMSDAAGEGVVEMDDRGLNECRNCRVPREGCRVPRVSMQMWHGRKMEVEVLEGATLVVVRPVKNGSLDMAVGDDVAAVAAEAFGSDGYEEAICEWMKGRSYFVDMDSFAI